MSTIRYSGRARVRVTYNDVRRADAHPNGWYRCAVFAENMRGHMRIVVGAPAHLEHAVDSPEAFDEAARAAFSLASQEDDERASDIAAALEWEAVADDGKVATADRIKVTRGHAKARGVFAKHQARIEREDARMPKEIRDVLSPRGSK